MQRTIVSWNPTDNTSICSDHFTANCFEADTTLASSFGINAI